MTLLLYQLPSVSLSYHYVTSLTVKLHLQENASDELHLDQLFLIKLERPKGFFWTFIFYEVIQFL